MNKNQNLSDQFKNAVSDAINHGDFQELNFLVTDTVTDAIAEAGSQMKKAADSVQKGLNHSPVGDIYQNIQNYQQQQSMRNRRFQEQNKAAPKLLPISKTKNVGQVSSILYLLCGGIGTSCSVFAILLGMIFFLIHWVWPAAVYIILLILLSLFLLMIRKGLEEKRRLSRMKRYITLCDDNMYVNIKYLAQQTGKSFSYVLKDVKKMLQLGFFPEGHLDAKGECLMLDHFTYQEYLKVEKERQLLAEEEAQKAKAREEKAMQNPELESMLQEGNDYIEKLQHLNDCIEGEVISEKLSRMENLLKEIFERVKDAPEQMPKMHRLMSYYLPTTIKLLQAYSEFDDVSTPGEDIISAKAEIEKTIDIINEAFVELLNKLFQTSAFDAAADAQVLQTMLAKEGLTKNKFAEETK